MRFPKRNSFAPVHRILDKRELPFYKSHQNNQTLSEQRQNKFEETAKNLRLLFRSSFPYAGNNPLAPAKEVAES